MLVNKWNDKEHKYFPHEIPDSWHISLIEFDMDKKINCVNCGKEIYFGDGYTSRRYHTDKGLGYMECKTCYFKYCER